MKMPDSSGSAITTESGTGIPGRCFAGAIAISPFQMYLDDEPPDQAGREI